jgi:hypothetical protein
LQGDIERAKTSGDFEVRSAVAAIDTARKDIEKLQASIDDLNFKARFEHTKSVLFFEIPKSV